MHSVQSCTWLGNFSEQAGAGYGTAQHSTAQHSTAQHSRAGNNCCSEWPASCSRSACLRAQHSTAQHSTAQHCTAGGTCCSEEPASVGPTARLAACLCAATLGVNWAASNNSRGPNSRKGRNTVTRNDARTSRSHRSFTVRACALAAWSPRPNSGAASSFASCVCACTVEC